MSSLNDTPDRKMPCFASHSAVRSVQKVSKTPFLTTATPAYRTYGSHPVGKYNQRKQPTLR